jgi:hypothetical protein
MPNTPSTRYSGPTDQKARTRNIYIDAILWGGSIIHLQIHCQ